MLTLYTVAAGKRFIDAAILCRRSFLEKNEGIEFRIFIPSREYRSSIEGAEPFEIPRLADHLVRAKPLIGLLFAKYGLVHLGLQSDYLGFIDADCYCLNPLPLPQLLRVLGMANVGAVGDGKAMIRTLELRDAGISTKWRHYFNSGVCFWCRGALAPFAGWFKKNADRMVRLPFNDQTWLNIYLNESDRKLYELGYFFNCRGGPSPDRRLYIWHPGGRGTKGIEYIKKYEEDKHGI